MIVAMEILSFKVYHSREPTPITSLKGNYFCKYISDFAKNNTCN